MSAPVRYARLGAFVLAGAALLAAGLVLFGAGSFLRTKFLVETYVDESVQGLDAGASVKFRGVEVGRVEAIGFARSKYAVEDSRVRIVIALSPDDPASLGKGEPAEVFARFVENGLRVRLASQGLTGGVYLELDLLKPEEHPHPKISWSPEFPLLPSVKSTGNKLMSSVESFLGKLERVKIEELIERMSKLLEEAGDVLRAVKPVTEDAKLFMAEATGLAKDVRKELAGETVKDLRAAVKALTEVLEKEVGPAVRQVRESAAKMPPTLEKAEAVLGQLDGTLKRLDRTLTGGGAQAEETLENLRVVTSDLRELTGTLKRYPAHAVLGEAPAKAKAVTQ